MTSVGAATRGPRSKRIAVDGRTFVEVPVAQRPDAVTADDWTALSQINDHIIERVRYDHRRAVAGEGTQSPAETLSRGLGVCRDYAALFEHLARRRGYRVRSMRSTRLDHAWNEVHLGGRWWIVDVTWNDGDIFSGGKRIPAHITGDSDYRKRYFLTTLDEELARQRAGLVASVHQASDATPVDYERTAEASALVDRISALVSGKKPLVARHNTTVDERNALGAEYNDVVRRYNAMSTAAQQAPLRRRLDELKAKLAGVDRRLEQTERDLDAASSRIDTLYAEFRRMDAAHPLAISYTLTKG